MNGRGNDGDRRGRTGTDGDGRVELPITQRGLSGAVSSIQLHSAAPLTPSIMALKCKWHSVKVNVNKFFRGRKGYLGSTGQA